MMAWKSKLNPGAVAGLIGGIVLLVTAIAMTATDPLSFLDLPSAILVVGGTLAASLITYSFDELRRAFVRFGAVLKRKVVVGKEDIDRFARVATLAHGGKPREIEKELVTASNPFVKTGLQLLADAMPTESVVNVLEWRMRHQESIERSEANVFRTMATYAPAFGMAGTLIGLINMLRLMGGGATPREIGMNLAFALITTLYGVVLANAFLKPIAAKIEKRTQDHMRVMGTIVEVFRAIGEGHGPSHIREMLLAIGATHENEIGDKDMLQTISDKDFYG